MTRIVLLEKPDKLGFGQEIMVLLSVRIRGDVAKSTVSFCRIAGNFII